MDNYCEVCLKNIKAKSKYKQFKSKSHLEFDKCNISCLTKILA